MSTQKVDGDQLSISSFEELLRSYGASTDPIYMLDNKTSGHLSLAANRTPMISGHLNAPAAFDGRFDRIHIPDDPTLDCSTFSVIAVVKTITGARQIASRWASSEESYGCWSMDLSGTSDKARFYVNDTGGATTLATSTGTAVTDGVKKLLVGTFDSSKVARLYVHADSPVVSSAMSGTPKNEASVANISIGGTRETNIIENNAGDGFKGTMGAFAYLPNVVLTQAQIDALRALL